MRTRTTAIAVAALLALPAATASASRDPAGMRQSPRS